MWRLNLRIDVRAQIKTRRAAIVIRQNLCANVDIGLARDARRPFDSAHSKSSLKRSQQVRGLPELQSQKIGDHLACYVIAGWTEPACDKKDRATLKQFGEASPNRFGIWHCALLLDPQTERKNLARDECKMCVLHIAEQKFGAGVQKSDAQVDRVEAFNR